MRASDPDRPTGLAIASVATFLVLVDFTVVLPTVQDTAAAFGSSTAWRTWALSAMSLGLAAFLLTAGTLADRVGRRRTARVGLVALAVGALLSAAAPSMAVFVVGRVVQGAAGAGVIAGALAGVGHAYPSGPARVRATGVWGASLGAGIAAGPVMSALAARAADWRAAYWLVGGAAAVVSIWAGRLVESRNPAERRLDVPGSLALVTAMSALTAGLVAGRQSWTGDATLTLAGVAGTALVLFVVIETRVAEPMLDLRLLRHPSFVNSVLGALVVGLSTIALMSYAPTYFEQAMGMTALSSGLLLCAWSATSAVAAWQAHRLPTFLRTRHRLLVGFVLCFLGTATLGQSAAHPGWPRLLPSLIVAGVGSGLANAALGQLAVASAPPGRPGLGSGANNTARYLGGAAGVAVVVALAVPSSSDPTTAMLVHGWNRAVWASAALCALGAVVTALCREPAARAAAAEPSAAGAPR